MRDALGIMYILILLVIAISCIFFPEKIQAYAVDYHARNKIARKLNPFGRWIATPSYVIWLRIAGSFSLVAAALLFFELFLR